MWKRIEHWLLGKIRNEVKSQLLFHHHVYGDSSRVSISSSAVVNNALFNVSSGKIVIKEHVFFGHNVCLLTGTHDITLRGCARKLTAPGSGNDIIIESGAWLSSNTTILGPCVVGENAVVAAGAVVTRDVPPGVVVAGVPAKIVRVINFSSNVQYPCAKNR